MDNISIPNESDPSKLFDHQKVLTEKHKNDENISFVEPQSMNYFIKISKMYLEFLKQDGKQTTERSMKS